MDKGVKVHQTTEFITFLREVYAENPSPEFTQKGYNRMRREGEKAMTGATQHILGDDRVRQLAQEFTRAMAQDGKLLFPANAMLGHRNRIESRAQSLGAAITAEGCEAMVLACYANYPSTPREDTVEMIQLVDMFLTNPAIKRHRKKCFPHKAKD
ncbi:hypothetical protein SAMN04515695_6094 [Pseudovibrio sp. Tun.PSC04-5.I4]|nr:hypothetical protein SAMN04515695_6094 [Pseudovibrio sp. Tun.PSC04-5.I4]